MSEPAKTEQDDAVREQAQLERAEVSDSELENVSGGQAEWNGSRMEVEQKGGGTEARSLD